MKKLNVYIVATNSDYTVLCVAENEKEAEKKANKYYYHEYGEKRDDFAAYNVLTYFDSENDILPFRTWID